MHVPKAARLKEEDVRSSIRKSTYEIERYFNVKDINYYIESWLLSPEVLALLDDNSNILKFSKLFSIKSMGECTRDILDFVFNDVYIKDYNLLVCKNLPEATRVYFTDLTTLHNNPKLSSIDYSSDEDIVGLFSKIAKELNYNSKKADFLFLEAQIKKIPKLNQKSITDKLPRFKEIANSNFDFKESLVDGF